MPPPPRAALADLAAVVPAGGACLLCRLPTLPFILLLPPIPPTRARRALFPGGEGGESKFSYARGFAPCIPGIRPPAALTEPAAVVSGGGLAFFVACCPPAFTFFFAPYPPTPLPRRGRGRLFSLFRRGLRPRHPCIKPFAALTELAKQVPGGRNPRFAAKTTGSGSLRAVPAAKERGDRGRGTSAFEMVLSPGAGRTSAARVQPRGFRGLRSRKNPAKPLTKHGFCDILSPELHRESGVLG